MSDLCSSAVLALISILLSVCEMSTSRELKKYLFLRTLHLLPSLVLIGYDFVLTLLHPFLVNP